MTEINQLSDAAAGWAAKINAAWHSSVEGIIEAGRLLTKAKADLEHGQFMLMVKRELPFKQRTANMLMGIAKDERLTNSQYVANLPPHWGTLYDLTKLSDAAFDRQMKDGTIRPDMQRKHVVPEVVARPNWIPSPPHEALALLVGDLIKRRQSLGMSQIELDERIGTPVGLIGKYEAFIRRPSAQALAEWAQALGGYISFVVGPLPSPALHKAESQLRIRTPI